MTIEELRKQIYGVYDKSDVKIIFSFNGVELNVKNSYVDNNGQFVMEVK